ncbi:hypothetical protein G6F46_011251 [Rhizopus delemar]|uniref:Endonuclease/exonuclease/phosphatase domain-containing protein n=3 Tax=Rhizopus TaxID=4842 RepID=I1CIB5_RHIO9|nr:hypothetical protein RO3G_12906 [Rhizopus delemar RA 99-880]KAG1448352.1 hypothetical protein G6F55_010686 [Rhizopus delemar]KAG1539423.1 hypothetical protein G6F51_009151 [Rhizopus arrhizus]KAG1490132.1 hypothetical protein G6F54_010950 [Rhizopus delemar]KAG1501439.1 hypothetical protein G6F53_011081 [Rhizopus delemar]|eukprot:EIE88195.1 hypothetical protein RO3G_12906 [Rhizopus delemar RA 99-880]
MYYVYKKPRLSSHKYICLQNSKTNFTPLGFLTAVLCFQDTAQFYASILPWSLRRCSVHLMNSASICGLNHHLVCQVINVYAPHLNPLIVSVSVDPSFRSLLFPKTPAKFLLFVDDFNMGLYAIHCPLASGFESLLPITLQNGSLLLNKGVSRSCIDPIYDHRSIQLRLAHALNRCLPTAWTDHSLLTFDLLLSCEGPRA